MREQTECQCWKSSRRTERASKIAYLLPKDKTLANKILHQLVTPFGEVKGLKQLGGATLDGSAVLPIEASNKSQELNARQLFIDERTIGDKTQPRLGVDGIVCQDP